VADAGNEEAGQMQREEEVAAATAKGKGELRQVRRGFLVAQEIDQRERERGREREREISVRRNMQGGEEEEEEEE
jgi:hypothetical protein